MKRGEWRQRSEELRKPWGKAGKKAKDANKLAEPVIRNEKFE